VAEVQALANRHYSPRDLGESIASGSFETTGMVVIPCSIKSLSAIANSYTDDLLSRAADVTLKEGRPLLLVVREAPLHAGHVRLLELASRAGAVIFPPVPAFYNRPQSLDEMVNHIVGRVLRRLGIENDLFKQWQGLNPPATHSSESLTAGQGAEPQPWNAETEGRVALEPDDEFYALPSMSLATQGADGQPHAAAVYFAADSARRNLYFFSDAASQHSQDMAASPRAAATIDPPASTWTEIRGLQLRGELSAVPAGEAWEQAWQIYQAKFPFVKDLREIVARNTLYTFRPDWVRRIDNRRGFGYKEEWTPA
jgi:flavin prenyltransferase